MDTLDPDDAGVSAGDSATGIDAPPPGACLADTDCSAGICHELTGACIPDADVLFVSPNGQGTACTRAAPCGALQTAIDARTQSRFTVALAPGTYSSSFDTTPVGGGVAKLVVSGPTRAPGGAVITSSAQGRIADNLTAIFEGLTIRGGSGSFDGIDNRGTTTLARVSIEMAGDYGAVSRSGTLTVLDSQITSCVDTGIRAEGGTLVVERTKVIGNGVWGIDVLGDAGYTVRNTIIARNGKALSQGGGVRIDPGGQPAIFRFNTLARNVGLSFPSLTCEGQVAISNVILGEASLVSAPMSPSCNATFSLFNTTLGVPPGMGNIMGDPKFVSDTDFHLQTGSPAIDKGNPMTAEPIDIDGQQRGTSPDIGADELP